LVQARESRRCASEALADRVPPNLPFPGTISAHADQDRGQISKEPVVSMCSSREAATFPDVEKRIQTSGMSTRRGEPGYKHIDIGTFI
jgi:hypothetical protein